MCGQKKTTLPSYVLCDLLGTFLLKYFLSISVSSSQSMLRTYANELHWSHRLDFPHSHIDFPIVLAFLPKRAFSGFPFHISKCGFNTLSR